MSNNYKTKILTSIKSLSETTLVLKKGVDIIDFKDPSIGALGALPIKKNNLFIKDHSFRTINKRNYWRY